MFELDIKWIKPYLIILSSSGGSAAGEPFQILTLTVWFHFIQILFGCIGLVGNVLCWVKFSRRSLACFHHLMLSLAVFDSLYIIMAILLFGVPALYVEYCLVTLDFLLMQFKDLATGLVRPPRPGLLAPGPDWTHRQHLLDSLHQCREIRYRRPSLLQSIEKDNFINLKWLKCLS